tara:strand:- start:45 stop:575 length:531 start_codon:yes stop_codon:yes gene_type:complete
MAKRFKKTMIKKIVITGPESCGKTTLAKSLGEIYKCHVVKEFARDYLNKLNRKYKYDDLLKIAKGQEKEEVKINALEKKILICDTSIHTIKIWSLDKFNKCDPWIIKKKENYNHYLLCYPDVPWKEDPLRENPHDRKRIFDLYLTELKDKPLTIISGNKTERIKQAQNVINRHIIS